MYENEIYSNTDSTFNANAASGSAYDSNPNPDSGSAGGAASDSNQNPGSDPAFASNSGAERYATYQTNGSAVNMEAAAEKKSPRAKKEKQKKKGGFRKVAFSAGLGLMFGVFAGAGFYGVKLGTERFLPAEKQESVDTVNPAEFLETMSPGMTNVSQVTLGRDDVTEVIKEVMPSMVSVINNYTGTVTTFWGQTYAQPGTSAGSGIIAAENDTELLIVTNNHVVADTDSLEVTFIDGTTANASIKGTDADMDLAVIAVPLENLTQETRNAIAIAALGESDNLELGTYVIAIGNALGYGQAVSDGMISALDREMTMEDGSVGTFIQTTAAINSGNSGGALFTIDGKVIGINSGKIKGTGVEGMGFAIPISSASPIIAELMERQTRADKVVEEERGYMGVSLQNVSEAAQQYGIPQGAFVYSLEEGSAAQKAGMKASDVIVKFDGQRVSSRDDVLNAMQYYKAGETVTISVKRANSGEYEDIDLEITLGSRPSGQ